MTTIKLKNGSGAPLAGDLVQGEPALDLTNKRLYTENSSGTVIEVGTNPGEDVTFADNRKALFGAGSDLQIYHDGSNSYIRENGTGLLYIGATDKLLIQDSTLTNTSAKFDTNADVSLYYNNAKKLETTSTGIDVTGSVVSDGLTVDGAVDINSSVDISGNLNMSSSGLIRTTDGTAALPGIRIGTDNDNGLYRPASNTIGFSTAAKDRMRIDGVGDISFYNNAGTSQDLYWDASTSRLGLGTTSPSTLLHLSDSSPRITLTDTDTGADHRINADSSAGNLSFDIDINSETTAPSYVVNMKGSEKFRISSTGAIDMTGDSIDGTSETSLFFRNRVNGGSLRLGVQTTGGTLYYPVLMNGTSDILTFNNAEGEMARFTTDGKLGLGTTAPYRTLTVSGDQAVEGLLEVTAATPQILFSVPSGGLDSRIHNDGSGNFIFGTGTNSATPTERMTISSAGDLTLGTAAVTGGRYFDIYNTGSTATDFAITRFITQQVGSASTTSADIFKRKNGEFTIANNETNSAAFINFKVGASERMRIDSSGNVGIGNSNPDTLLHIGNINATNATGQGRIKLEDASTSLTSAGGLEFVTSAFGSGYGWKVNSIDATGVNLVFATRQNSTTWAEKARLDYNGNLLVGLTSSNYLVADDGIQLNATGTARFGASGTTARNLLSFVNGTDGTPAEVGTIQTNGSSTSYNTSSDQRLKENIVDAPSASDDIDAIQVRSFDWKTDGSHQKYGMVAQELQSVAPDAVSEGDTEEDMMGVDYSKLVPMMLKEIQSLRARVAQLEGAN